MKKTILFLICLSVMFHQAHAYDFSAVAPSGQTLYYNIKTPSTLECVGPGGVVSSTWSGYTEPSGALIIPSTVTHSGTTYTVKTIANYALSQCSTLTAITIPSSVNQIGERAFYYDTALHTINLPTTGILFGENVFEGTGWYQDQPNGLVCLGNTLIGYKGVIPANYSLVVPSNVISIAGTSSNASYGNVVSVSFPASLKYIGDKAFWDYNITTITLPDSLKAIGKWAFNGSHITTITIPSKVEYIGSFAFGQCSSLTSVTYNAIYASVGELENGITYCPFYNCQNLTSISVGNSVQNIPRHLFDGCTGISGSLVLPPSLQSIEERAFNGCTGISGILTSPNSSLSSIGTGAFSGCSGISGALILPNSLHVIGLLAFMGCTGITSLTVGTSVDSIASFAFSGMTNLTTINYNAINCSYADYTFSGTNISNFNIGSSVQTIPDNLIYQSSLSSVIFPNTITRIGSMNFSQCSLTGTLVLPASLTQVGYDAFTYCTNLTGIQCNATTPPTIESQYGMSNAFGNWNTPLFVPCSSISAYQSAACWGNFTNISGIGGCNYTITLSVNNSAMGSVSGGGTYTQGATATIAATANSGYHFDHWSDGNTQNPRTITVTQDVTLVAYFAQDEVQTYTVTLNTNNASMGSVSGGGTFNAGSTITISATAYSGYHFDHWSDGNTQNPRSITVNSNITLTAYFVQNTPTYIVTVNSNNTSMGTVTGGGTYEQGSVITIAAIPNNGYHFDHWSDGNTQNPRSITVTSNITLTAYFVRNATTYTVIVNSNNPSMGSVSGGGTFEEGTTITLTATANNGYRFDHWSDGNTQNPRSITVNSNITLTAYFEQNIRTYTVTVTSNNTSMGTVSGGGTYNEGATAILTATANSGYHFVRWSDFNTENPRNIVVNSNIRLVAYFMPDVGIEDIDGLETKVYAKGHQIHIEEATGEGICVYTIDGRTIASLQRATEHVVIPVTVTGVYIVKIGNFSAKKVVVVR